MSRIRSGAAQQIVDLLRGAADLAGRSPYPLVEAAERIGLPWLDLPIGQRSPERPSIWQFEHARRLRDDVRAEVGARPQRLILLEAAQRLADRIDPSPRRGRRTTINADRP